MREKVEAALVKIRPILGGTDVVLMDLDEGIVKVRVLTSSCAAGMSPEMTIEILEEQLKELVPDVKEVIAV